ncbi:hypothetical protein JW877_04455 [bacterium]|nr:hypothetical protein [bacterium]
MISLRVANLQAAELEIDYTDFCYSSIKIGKHQNLEPGFRIFNSTSSEKSYSVKLVGLESDDYYQRIPDFRWVKLPSEVKVPEDSFSIINLRLDIPGDSQYYNRRWSFGVVVQENRRSGLVDLVGMIRIMVETEGSDQEKNGKICAPTEIYVANYDTIGYFEFWVWNNAQKALDYRIKPNMKEREVQRKLGFNHEGIDVWLDDSSFSLLPDSSKRCKGFYKTDDLDGDYESILFIGNNRNQKDFIRILISNRFNK